MMWYAPSRGALRIVGVGYYCYHRGHQAYKPHRSDPHSARQQGHDQQTRGVSRPRSKGEHRQTLHVTAASHCHATLEPPTEETSSQSPKQQSDDDQSGATSLQRELHGYYNLSPCKSATTPRHAPPPYFSNSWRSFSTSIGTPTAPRSLICVSGLRISCVSGLPGSTRYIGIS